MREGDRVARTHADPAAAGEVIDRPRDDSKTHAVELTEERRDLARQRPVHQRLEQDGLGAILALVHRDELSEDRIRTFSAGPPSLDPADQALRPAAQCRVDEALLCWRVEVHRSRRHMGTPRHFADPEVRISAPRDLA